MHKVQEPSLEMQSRGVGTPAAEGLRAEDREGARPWALRLTLIMVSPLRVYRTSGGSIRPIVRETRKTRKAASFWQRSR